MQSPISDPKASNLIFMLQRKIANQQLKILTQLEENIPKLYRPKDDFKLAQITIYTDKAAFEGELRGNCIAKQLSWNAESMNTLLECLMGKREKVEMRFSAMSKGAQLPSFYQFEIICEISSGINLTLFTIQMTQAKISNPFLHMKAKFSSLQSTFRSRQRSYKQREQKLKAELNQIEAVQKQIIYSSTTEITLMKKEFIKHVNKEKAKIRKLMGSVPMINPVSGLIENRGVGNGELGRIAENPYEEEEQQNTQSMKKNRQVRKIDREKYNKPTAQKLQIDSQSQQPSSNSHVSDNFKRQKPHGQKRKKRFAQDDSSSDQENNYSEGENKVEKTFLQQQRQRLERQKMENNGKDDGQDDWDKMFN